MPTLRPTLWRTCRALANQNRLKILGALLHEPGQPVSAVAKLLDLPLPVASQYLRGLEARGLLAARRKGKHVIYRPGQSTSGTPFGKLMAALEEVFKRDDNAGKRIIHVATAFTHPRRIEIFRALQLSERTLEQLRVYTRISLPALLRHLSKLEARDFIVSNFGVFSVSTPPDELHQALARLATEP